MDHFGMSFLGRAKGLCISLFFCFSERFQTITSQAPIHPIMNAAYLTLLGMRPTSSLCSALLFNVHDRSSLSRTTD